MKFNFTEISIDTLSTISTIDLLSVQAMITEILVKRVSPEPEAKPEPTPTPAPAKTTPLFTPAKVDVQTPPKPTHSSGVIHGSKPSTSGVREKLQAAQDKQGFQSTYAADNARLAEKAKQLREARKKLEAEKQETKKQSTFTTSYHHNVSRMKTITEVPEETKAKVDETELQANWSALRRQHQHLDDLTTALTTKNYKGLQRALKLSRTAKQLTAKVRLNSSYKVLSEAAMEMMKELSNAASGTPLSDIYSQCIDN